MHRTAPARKNKQGPKARLAMASRARAVRLRSDMTVSAAMRRVVAECERQLRKNVPGILAHGDAECVHQARVALRRLRSADLAFSEIPAAPFWGKLMLDAQWLAGLLGNLRDLQVLSEETLPLIAQACTETATGIATIAFAPLQAELERRVARARAALLRALQSQRCRDFLRRLQQWLDADPEAGRKHLEAFARRSLTRRWRRVDTLARHWQQLDPAERHRLRKRVKKLRYAIEFFAALFPAKAVANYVKQLERMQAALGNLNDTVAARALLRPQLQRASTAPATSAVLGWLHCSERNQLGAAAAAIACWRRSVPFWR